MEAWTQWFLRKLQENQWSTDEMSRQSGLTTTMISRYRQGRAMPRRSDQIAKITAVFGDPGPLPQLDRFQVRSMAERLDELEAEVSTLRGRVAALERPRRPESGAPDAETSVVSSDPDGLRKAIEGSAAGASAAAAARGSRKTKPRRHPRA